MSASYELQEHKYDVVVVGAGGHRPVDGLYHKSVSHP
jgi:hypothetical protein